MHPSVQWVLKSFTYDHLPEGPIRDTSKLFADLAHLVAHEVPTGPDVTAGLRKLWEAKNLFVYAVAAAEKEKQEA